jgi:O-6-methylguanine DNA methyltransferase
LDLIEYNIQESSLGYILLVAKNGRLFQLDMMAGEPHRIKKEIAVAYPGSIDSEKPFRDIWKDIDRYFKGGKVEFRAEIDISDLRPFTQKVLKELMNIPYGELRSYGWIGKRLGYPSASRAVGQAVGRNPIPIIIPCHRVIRQDGSIGGFSSGIHIKKILLSIEGSIDTIKRT